MRREEEKVKTIVISVISVSSILYIIMIQGTVNLERRYRDSLEGAMSSAMHQTLTEVMEKGSYGIRDSNQMMAALLQAMIARLDAGIDLTVRVRHLDYESGRMDLEAVGSYELPNHKRKCITVRRQIAFNSIF